MNRSIKKLSVNSLAVLGIYFIADTIIENNIKNTLEESMPINLEDTISLEIVSDGHPIPSDYFAFSVNRNTNKVVDYLGPLNLSSKSLSRDLNEDEIVCATEVKEYKISDSSSELNIYGIGCEDENRNLLLTSAIDSGISTILSELNFELNEIKDDDRRNVDLFKTIHSNIVLDFLSPYIQDDGKVDLQEFLDNYTSPSSGINNI